MFRFPTLFVLAITLSAASGAFADEKELNFEVILYSSFKTIERFRIIDVSLGGSSEKIGLKEEDLTDYLRLRFKNSFAGIEFKKLEPFEILKIIQDEKAKSGKIHVHVWTVGDDYPIAFHIEMQADNMSAGYAEYAYEHEILGYGSKQNVPDSVRESISKLMDNLAVAFFKARGEL